MKSTVKKFMQYKIQSENSCTHKHADENYFTAF